MRPNRGAQVESGRPDKSAVVYPVLSRAAIRRRLGEEYADWCRCRFLDPKGSGWVKVVYFQRAIGCSPITARRRLAQAESAGFLHRHGKMIRLETLGRVAVCLGVEQIPMRSMGFKRRWVMSKHVLAYLAGDVLSHLAAWRGRDFTVSESANLFGVCERTVQRWLKHWAKSKTYKHVASLRKKSIMYEERVRRAARKRSRGYSIQVIRDGKSALVFQGPND